MRVALFALALLGCAGAQRPPTPAAPTRFLVRWRPQYPVGARYLLDVHLAKEREVRIEREGVPPESLRDRGEAHLRANVEVLERDAAHERLRYTLTEASQSAYFRHAFLLRPAQVFVVSSRVGAGEVTDGAGAPVTGPLLRSVSDFIDIAWSGPAEDDDATFGTPDPRAVGDAWPVHPSVGQGDITGGTIRLTGVRDCAGATCLVLHGDLTTRIHSVEAPEGLHLEQPPATFTLDVWLPADPTRLVRRTSSVMRESHVIVDDAEHVRRSVEGVYGSVHELAPAP